MTADRNGDAAGTLTRPDGARADYARINGVELFRGDASWWKGDPQETDKVQRLAGVWVSNPLSEVSGLSNQIAGPEEVASDIGPPNLGSVGGYNIYREVGTRDVAGQPGRVLEGIARKVVLTRDGDPQVLAIVPTLSEIPVGVSRAEPAALAVIGERRPVRDAAPDYTKALFERPTVNAQIVNAAPVCTTPECTATVRLVNASRFDAQGSLQVLLNGSYADFSSFTLRPNETKDVPVSARNPAPAGQQVPLRWEAKVTAY